MIEKQLKYVDIARGIGITLVVIGHSITKDMATVSNVLNYLRLFIYTIHMPLFFIISGYLFEKNRSRYESDSIKNYCINKLKVFMIPYIAFSILNYLIITIAMLIPPIKSILSGQGYYLTSFKEILFSIITYINHQDGHLWFCYVMALVLIVNRLCFMKKSNVMVCGILIAVYFASYMAVEWVPEVIWKTMRYLLIFYVGRMIYSFDFKEDTKIKVSSVISVVAFLALIVCRDYGLNLFSPFLTLILEISASIVILLGISAFLSEKKIGEKIECLGKGKVSYVIYLLHMPFMTSTMVFIMEKLNIPMGISIVLTTIGSIAICLLLYKFILSKNIICKFCLGMDIRKAGMENNK